MEIEFDISANKAQPQSNRVLSRSQSTLENFLGNSAPKVSNVQITLDSFLVPKSKEPFYPVDIQREYVPKVEIRRRGRQPKDRPTIKKIKAEQPSLIIEKVENDVLALINKEEKEEHKEQKNSGKRGKYTKITFQDKKNILEEFNVFKSTPRKNANGTIFSFNDFCFEIEANTGIKSSTVKKICLYYEKNPSIYTQLQIMCSNEKKARQNGQIKQRNFILTYDKQLDWEIYDWISFNLDLGVLVTRANIKDKAKELIAPNNPSFKASDCWLSCFLQRHHLSLRKLNEKSEVQQGLYQELSAKFVLAMKDIIKKNKIQPQFVLNMDETPFYWEYLPRKVASRKLDSKARGWKKGYHQTRSTIALTTAADGTVLRPLLIVKRMTPYILQRRNKINMLLLNSESGWMTEQIMLKWIEEVLFPYVGNNNCLLLMDSFEAHLTLKVQETLNKRNNIKVGVIVGGATDRAQPLDNGTNKSFKDACRKISIDYSNALLKSAQESQEFSISQNQSNDLVKGKIFISSDHKLIK